MRLLLDAPVAEVGGGHYLCYSWGFAGKHKNCQSDKVWVLCFFYVFKLYMLALVGRPSLHSYDAWYGLSGSRGIQEKLQAKIW